MTKAELEEMRRIGMAFEAIKEHIRANRVIDAYDLASRWVVELRKVFR